MALQCLSEPLQRPAFSKNVVPRTLVLHAGWFAQYFADYLGLLCRGWVWCSHLWLLAQIRCRVWGVRVFFESTGRWEAALVPGSTWIFKHGLLEQGWIAQPYRGVSQSFVPRDFQQLHMLVRFGGGQPASRYWFWKTEKKLFLLIYIYLWSIYSTHHVYFGVTWWSLVMQSGCVAQN